MDVPAVTDSRIRSECGAANVSDAPTREATLLGLALDANASRRYAVVDPRGNRAGQEPKAVAVERPALDSMLDFTIDTIVRLISTIMLTYFLRACGNALLRKLVTATSEREDHLQLLEILYTIKRMNRVVIVLSRGRG